MPGFCGILDGRGRGAGAPGPAEAAGWLDCPEESIRSRRDGPLLVYWDSRLCAAGEADGIWTLFYGKQVAEGPPADRVLQARASLGDDWPRALHGQYAALLWERGRRRFTLVRERLGLHQLYYALEDGALLFGTTLPSVIGAAGRRPSLSPTASLDFMMFGFVPSHETICRGIARLPPAHSLILDDGAPPRLTQYWDIDFGEAEPRKDGDALGREYLARLEEGIRWHGGGRGVAVAFSGGIDSALLARLSLKMGLPVHTFTLCYTGSSGQESAGAWSRDLARKMGTTHHEIVLGPREYLRLHAHFVQALGEPVNADSCGLLRLCEEAQRCGCGVVLSGNGVESNIGRQNLMAYSLWAEAGARLPAALRAAVEMALCPLAKGRLWQPLKQSRLIWLLRRDPGLLSWYILNPGQSFSDMSFYLRSSRAGGDDMLARSPALGLMSRCLSVDRPWSRFHKAIYCSQKSWLINAVGYYIHRTGELSIPVAQPYLYPPLTDFLYSLPDGWKLEWPRCKRILYRAAAHLFPPEVTSRPKDRVAGFGLLDWTISRLPPKSLRTLRELTLGELGGYDFLAPLLRIPERTDGWRREPCGRLYTLALWHRRHVRGLKDADAVLP